MKGMVFILALIGLLAFAMPPEVAAAPDTLDVAAVPPGNINTVINSDTTAGGVRAHPDRVYRLNRGSVYQVTEPLKVNGNLYMTSTAGTNRPPVLAPAILGDNSSVDHFFEFIGKGGDVSLTNLYILGQRADNNWPGWFDGIRINADSVKLKMRGVIVDGLSHGAIFPSYWTKLDIQDCEFRNLQHSSSWFAGDAFLSGNVVALDTVRIINNTFFASNATMFNVRGYTPLALFEHNTCVFGTVYTTLIRNANFARMKNNIFYSLAAMGGYPDPVINGWFLNYPDTASTSILQIRGLDSVSYWSKLWNTTFTGPELYADPAHGVSAEMVSENIRVFDIQNNAYFWPTKLTDFYRAYNDTVATYDSVDVPVYGGGTVKQYLKRIVYPPTWLTTYNQWTIDSLAGPLSSGIIVQNNQEVDPGFPAVTTNHIDSLIYYLHEILTGTLDANRWCYPTNNLYPATWPLPENMAYTNAALLNAGTDGFALGDLNWFPEQKAAWLLTDVKRVNELPEGYSLSQNYPNPFNPSTEIAFSIPAQSNVELKVFNLLGQEVATLVNQTMAPGSYTVDFNAAHLASGMYVYRLKADNFVSTYKMVLMK